MKVLIIYCHPSKESYTHEILQQLVASLENEKLQYEVSDLYAINFQSEMTEAEYQREGFANTSLPIPNDIQIEHQKIESADCIIFLYPVWWSDCPAKLKGWFDRVYSVGYAYGKANSTHKMKTISYGLVICTAGHPNDYLKEIGIASSMRNVMIDDRLGQRFEHKEMITLGGTLDMEKVRDEHCAVVAGIGSLIKSTLNLN